MRRRWWWWWCLRRPKWEGCSAPLFGIAPRCTSLVHLSHSKQTCFLPANIYILNLGSQLKIRQRDQFSELVLVREGKTGPDDSGDLLTDRGAPVKLQRIPVSTPKSRCGYQTASPNGHQSSSKIEGDLLSWIYRMPFFFCCVNGNLILLISQKTTFGLEGDLLPCPKSGFSLFTKDWDAPSISKCRAGCDRVLELGGPACLCLSFFLLQKLLNSPGRSPSQPRRGNTWMCFMLRWVPKKERESKRLLSDRLVCEK